MGSGRTMSVSRYPPGEEDGRCRLFVLMILLLVCPENLVRLTTRFSRNSCATSSPETATATRSMLGFFSKHRFSAGSLYLGLDPRNHHVNVSRPGLDMWFEQVIKIFECEFLGHKLRHPKGVQDVTLVVSSTRTSQGPTGLMAACLTIYQLYLYTGQ